MSTCVAPPSATPKAAKQLEPVRRWTPGIVFLCSFALVWLLVGNAFNFTNDEGIYLEGGRSLVEGKILYKDHFALTGPGTYWLLAFWFKLFGVTVAVGRIPFLFAIAISTTFVFWFVDKHVSRKVAILASILCFILLTATPDMQNTNHRWDGAGLMCLAILFYRRPVLSGILAAAAAWCCPPVLLAGGVVAFWQWREKSLKAFLAGGAACSAVSVAILALTGSLPYIVSALLWARDNYAGVNRVPYGFVIGGFENIFAGGSFEYFVVAGIVVLGMLTPALCPVLNLLSIRKILRCNSEVAWVTACSFALVASTYPRSDTHHLTYVLAPSFAVSVWVLSQLRVGKYIGRLLGVSCVLIFCHTVVSSATRVGLETRAGYVRTHEREQNSISLSESVVRPNSSLFVYPYMPMTYFLTRGVNPTPFPFLFPGMMTPHDEARVVKNLESAPPEKIFYLKVTPEALSRIWPAADLGKIRMENLESWIEKFYESDPSARHIDGYRLYHRKAI